MIRIPVTLADFKSPRYNSSISKLRSRHPSFPKAPKLLAMRQAFAQALGYGGEAELVVCARRLGSSYTGSPLAIADVIASVSQRIARQWNVTLETAESITLALGLHHFDACRPVPRNTSHQVELIVAAQSVTSPTVENSQDLPRPSIVEDNSSTAMRNTPLHRLPSTSLQAELDRLNTGNPLQAEIDRLTRESLWQVNTDVSAAASVLGLDAGSVQSKTEHFSAGASLKALGFDASLGMARVRDLNAGAAALMSGLDTGSVLSKIEHLSVGASVKSLGLNAGLGMAKVMELNAGAAALKSSLDAAGLGIAPFKDLKVGAAVSALGLGASGSAMAKIRDLNESAAVRAIKDWNESPTVKAIKDFNAGAVVKALGLNAGSALARVERLNASPAMTMLERLNKNPAIAALDRLYAIPAIAKRLSPDSESDAED